MTHHWWQIFRYDDTADKILRKKSVKALAREEPGSRELLSFLPKQNTIFVFSFWKSNFLIPKSVSFEPLKLVHFCILGFGFNSRGSHFLLVCICEDIEWFIVFLGGVVGWCSLVLCCLKQFFVRCLRSNQKNSFLSVATAVHQFQKGLIWDTRFCQPGLGQAKLRARQVWRRELTWQSQSTLDWSRLSCPLVGSLS